MIKMRDARYCNLKLLLIYLVVYGHWIEPGIWDCPALMVQYRWIYLVHMPLFSFVSGLFLHDAKGCLRQLRRTLPLYLLLQVAAVLLGNGAVKLSTPWWHLWYLLSFSCWSGLGWLWFRFGKGRGGILLLAVSLLVGCAAGSVSWIGRPFSLSRTLVFLPYFWAGLLCRADFPWQKLRPVGVFAGCLAAVYLFFRGSNISVTALYHAGQADFPFRLQCYLLGGLMCLFLLTVIPVRRFPFTRAGADTMPIYLIHAPIVWLLRQADLPWSLCPLLCGGLIYGIYKVRQWNNTLFGIVPGERRDSLWLRSGKSTKNTPNRYTDSCCP